MRCTTASYASASYIDVYRTAHGEESYDRYLAGS
jgi:hypothetical protein